MTNLDSFDSYPLQANGEQDEPLGNYYRQEEGGPEAREDGWNGPNGWREWVSLLQLVVDIIKLSIDFVGLVVKLTEYFFRVRV